MDICFLLKGSLLNKKVNFSYFKTLFHALIVVGVREGTSPH
mgnify:CR=1 FL=1